MIGLFLFRWPYGKRPRTGHEFSMHHIAEKGAKLVQRGRLVRLQAGGHDRIGDGLQSRFFCKQMLLQGIGKSPDFKDPISQKVCMSQFSATLEKIHQAGHNGIDGILEISLFFWIQKIEKAGAGLVEGSEIMP